MLGFITFIAWMAIVYGIVWLIGKLPLRSKKEVYTKEQMRKLFAEQKGYKITEVTDSMIQRIHKDSWYTGKTIEGPLFKLKYGLISFAVGLPLAIIMSFVVKIAATDVGVVVTPGGVNEEVLTTGWHLVPWWKDVYKMDKTIYVYTCARGKGEGQRDSDEIWAPTSDGIKMGFDISVNWRIDPLYAWWIYKEVDATGGSRYDWLEENVIRPKLKSALALEVSNYSPVSVYSTARDTIQYNVYKRIQKDVKDMHLIIDQTDLREVYYLPAYEEAITQKKLAEQEALRQVDITKQEAEKLNQSRIKADQRIETARGEAESLLIKGRSIAQNPKIIQLEWIDKWNGQLPTYMLGDKGGSMIMLNPK